MENIKEIWKIIKPLIDFFIMILKLKIFGIPIYVFIISIVVIIEVIKICKYLLYKFKKKKYEYCVDTEYKIYPYCKKNLLSNNELNFYKELKPIAEKLKLHIIAKVRIADFVDTEKGLSYFEKWEFLSKITQKHIDFILCNPENLSPILLIELDDNSHETEKRKERDKFVEEVYKKAEYKLLRVRNADNIESKILECINKKSSEP